MNRKMIIETASTVLTVIRTRFRFAGDQQAVVVQTAAALPLTSAELILRPSKVLPGQVIVPVAVPIHLDEG